MAVYHGVERREAGEGLATEGVGGELAERRRHGHGGVVWWVAVVVGGLLLLLRSVGVGVSSLGGSRFCMQSRILTGHRCGHSG